MDTLLSLKVFREVVEAGSFIAAAKRLRLSPAATTKHVAHLESTLGARLLNRTSRQISLTEAGTVYFDQCQEALDTLQAAEASLGLRAEAPRGILKVTAPVWCANPLFAKMLGEYQERYPDVVVDLRLENRKVDLVGEGYDLALRATRDPSPALIVKPLHSIQFFLVATPDYLNRMGRPKTSSDLTRHRAILPSHLNVEAFELEGPLGKVLGKPQTALLTDNTTMDYHAMRAGMGLAFLPEWSVAEDLKAGIVEKVLPEYKPAPVPLFAAYTSRRYLTPKVRTFIDFFSEALAQKECPSQAG